MYHNKHRLYNKLLEILSNTELEDEDKTIKLDSILTLPQKHSLIRSLINGLPKSNLEHVTNFHKAFKVEKEPTNVIADFKYADLRLALIFEEAIELAFALGKDSPAIGSLIFNLISKVGSTNPKPSLTSVYDALLDLLFVTEGTVDVFNLSEIIDEGMQEVTKSNMSKLIPVDTEGGEDSLLATITQTVTKYSSEGTPIRTQDLKNGYVAVLNRDTGKILKPVTYKLPNLELIIHRYLTKNLN